MNLTSIEWTTFSANPLKYRDAAGKVVWACVHASPGCIHCYSEALAKRYGRGGPFNVPTMAGLTPFLDEDEMHHMRTAKTIKGEDVSGSRCFVEDMSDLFGEWVSDDLLNQLFSNVLEFRRDVTWQLLTKRAERMQRYLSWRWGEGRLPCRHIHVGVSCENQKALDARLPWLLQTPAAVRFISAEPLIEFTNLRLREGFCRACKQFTPGTITGHCFDPKSPCFAGEMGVGDGIDQVIAGAESGNGARDMHEDWVRSIRDECQATGVAFFYKQKAVKGRKVPLPRLDGRCWAQFPKTQREAVHS